MTERPKKSDTHQGSQGDALTEPGDLASLEATKVFDSQSRFPKIEGYEILGLLGRGGMGVVYKAFDLKLKRHVALKMVLVGEHASAQTMARFRIEAETVARLRHPNIVQIFEVGEFRGQPFLTFELVEGTSLSRLVAGEPQSTEIAVELMEIIARAVHYAHEKSVVHRDLKPGNILVEQTSGGNSDPTESNAKRSETKKSATKSSVHLPAARTTSGGLVPKISDFGLAKQLDDDAAQTSTGQVLGTARYMAPEQAAGEKVSPAADLYSLGTILYELLVGRTPFHGSTAVETLQMLRRDEPMPIRRLQPRLPKDLETICMKCLEKEPSKRYVTAELFANDLGSFLRGEPIAARPVGRLERTAKWARRRPTVAALGMILLLTIALGFTGVTWQWTKTLAAQRRGAETQVDLLLHARAEAVSTVVANLEPYRRWVNPELRSMLELPKLSVHDRDRVNLGLLPVDPSCAQHLNARMDSIDEPMELAEFLIVRDALFPFRDDFAAAKWLVLRDPTVADAIRFRAAMALCLFDPPAKVSDERWNDVAPFIATQLLKQANVRPNDHAALTESLYPMRRLLLPTLTAQLKDKDAPPSQRSTTASIVADYAHDVPQLLVALCIDSDAHEHAIFLPHLSDHKLVAIGQLRDELDKELADGSESEKDTLASRQAIAAITLAHLGRDDLLWRSLAFHSAPRQQTYLIHRMADYQIPIRSLTQRLSQEPDPAMQQALLLSVGGYDVKQIDTALLDELTRVLVDDYQRNPDCGVHSTIEWLLNRWQRSNELHATQTDSFDRSAEHHWFRNAEGHVFSVVPGPISFRMGSPVGEPGRRGEQRHWCRIASSYAIATREVTLAQFQRFIDDNPALQHEQDARYGPDPSGPAINVSWMKAAMYCRWLSDLEDLPESEMCYPPIDEFETDPAIMPPLPENFAQRRGYRLPTEGEWEYACRGGTITSRFFGYAPELIDHYGWHIENSGDRVFPAGLLKPNRLGLFDVYGNVWEWCQNRRDRYPEISQSPLGSQDQPVRDDHRVRIEKGKSVDRIIRGGSITNRVEVLRSAQREWYAPGPSRNHNVGFRVATSVAPRTGE